MNIFNLKRAAAGYVFRISEGEDQNGWYDNMQPLPSSLINSTTPKFTEAEKPKQVQIQVGQTEQGEPIWETQDAASQPAKLGLKDAYTAGQEADYANDLQNTLDSGVGIKASSMETGEDTWQGYMPEKAETFTPEQAIELYNNMDTRLANDPVMAGRLAAANKYYKEEGAFIPGSNLATADNFKSYIVQSDLDAAKQQKNQGYLAAATLGLITGGAMLAGGAAGAGGAAVASGTGTATGGGLTSAQLAAASAEAVASGGAAGGAAASTAAGSGMGATAGGTGASFLSSPMGKFAVGQGISLGAKALSGAGKDQKQNPGLMNSSQNRPAQQPIVNNYYSGQQQRPAPAPAPTPRPIASANGSMYGSGSGFGTSINKYAQKKSASGG